MKLKKVLPILLAFVLAVGMVVPSLAALVTGENAGSQAGETYFTPGTAVVTQTPDGVETVATTTPGVWKFAYPVVLWELNYTVVNATDAAQNRFEGYIGDGKWETIGDCTEAGGKITTTSTYAYAEIRYTGDPTAVTDVTFRGQYLRGVSGDPVEVLTDTIVATENRVQKPGFGPENMFDHDRNTRVDIYNETDDKLSNDGEPYWMYVELANPTVITELVVYHYTKGGYLWMEETKFEFSQDGVNWVNHVSGLNAFNGIFLSKRSIKYTAEQWAANQNQVKADPTYKSQTTASDGSVTVNYFYNYDNYAGGYVVTCSYDYHQNVMPFKYIRITGPRDWTFAMEDLNIYGIEYTDGTPLKTEWADTRMVPSPVETLIPVQEKELVWKLDGATQITNIAYAGTDSLAGGKWYGATEIATNWYEIGSISGTETSGDIAVTNTIGFKYVKFVGNTDVLTASSVTFTGRKLNVRGQFIEWATDANGAPAVVHNVQTTGGKNNTSSNSAANIAAIPNVLKHDLTLSAPYVLGYQTINPYTGSGNAWPVYIGGKLSKPSTISEVVIYQNLGYGARVGDSTYLEASYDGITWTRLPMVNVSSVGAIDAGLNGISKDATNQGYVYQIDLHAEVKDSNGNITTAASVAYREWQYVRLYRQAKDWGFQYVAMDVYGCTYGTMSSGNILNAGSGIIAPTAPATQSATLLDAKQVTVQYDDATILTEINNLAAGPYLKLEGSVDGKTWFYLSPVAANQYNRGKITINGTAAVHYVRFTSNVGINVNSVKNGIKGYVPGLTGERLTFDNTSIQVTGAYSQSGANISSHNLLRAWNHNRVTYHTGSVGLGSSAGYHYGMFTAPAKITEVMIWPNSNYPERADSIQIQAATAEDPDNWVTLTTIDLYPTDKASYNAAIYGQLNNTTYPVNQTTGVKYTFNDDTAYTYFRLYKNPSQRTGQEYCDNNLCVATFEVFGMPAETGNPLNGDTTNAVWFVIAPVSLALCGTTAWVLRKKKSRI